jgi:hypothetical protein
MLNQRIIRVTLVVTLGLFIVSAFLSSTAFAESMTPGNSLVPVYISFKPNPVTHTESLTTTYDDKGSKSYSFNEWCAHAYKTGPNGNLYASSTTCKSIKLTLHPGHPYSGTATAECSPGLHYNVNIYVANTAKHYQSPSATLFFKCS